MDGKKQRQAVNAAERAIIALGSGDPDGARRAIAKAVELDQIGAYSDLRSAVALAADELEHDLPVSDAAWDGVAAAVEPGPLEALVDQVRD